MKTSFANTLCVGATLLILSSSLAIAQRKFPARITGGFLGNELTVTSPTTGSITPTALSVSRGGNNLRITSTQVIDGQFVTMQTVLRSNGTADTFTKVDGVVLQSGTGRFSRRGRTLNANFGTENALGAFFLNQRFTVRGNRVAVSQITPQFGTASYLLGRRVAR